MQLPLDERLANRASRGGRLVLTSSSVRCLGLLLGTHSTRYQTKHIFTANQLTLKQSGLINRTLGKRKNTRDDSPFKKRKKDKQRVKATCV